MRTCLVIYDFNHSYKLQTFALSAANYTYQNRTVSYSIKIIVDFKVHESINFFCI